MPTVTKQRVTNSKPVKGASVLDRIMDVADAAQTEGLKFATIGRSGTGKTRLLSTWPKPLLHIVCSNSAAGEVKSVQNVKGIKTVTLQDEEELPILVAEARKTGQWATIGLDHVSGYSDLGIKKILNLAQAPVQLAWGTLTQAQYGELGALMKERLRDLLSLPCNVVINSQERESNNEGNAHEMLMPSVSFALTPSLAGWLAPAVDYLVYSFIRMGKVKTGRKTKMAGVEVDITVDKPEFCIRTGPHPVYATKFRVPVGMELPDIITDPTYEKIAALVNGKA